MIKTITVLCRMFAVACIGFFGVITPCFAASYSVSSPDGSINALVSDDNDLSISVTIDGKPLLLPSAVGLITQEHQHPLKITRSAVTSVDRVLTPIVAQKTEHIADHYNELKLEIENFGHLVVRAYDSGVAYRFDTQFDGQITVLGEVANYQFAENTNVYFPREEQFISHNERLYEKTTLAQLNEEDLASLPLLVESSAAKMVITESDLRDYPGMWITGGPGESLNAVFPKAVKKWHLKRDRDPVIDERYSHLAETAGNRTFPWRIMTIARDDIGLVENQLSWQLAAPSMIEDTSWIEPGLVAWDWWHALNIQGVDFRAGVNTQTYKHYIDFAAENGIPYIILDEGWYELGDVLQVVPEIDIDDLLAYAKEKNVKVILWVVWETLDQKLEEALTRYEEWGAAGIKVDFMQRDDQWMVNYYWRVAEAAARHKLLVDFHGSFKPAGLRRTFPNVMTREGVKGLENMKWSSKPDAEHNVTLPFIRMVAGPMDYTPGAMVNVRPKDFSASFERPMSLTTRAHQLALYVVFESPLQMLADSPSNYRNEQESLNFITQIPTVWSDTIALDGKVGDYIVMARRSGENWYVGALTDEHNRTVKIDLSFLDTHYYKMISFADGINADRHAEDYTREETSITSKDKLTVKLAPNGGWTAILTPKKID